MSDQIPDEIEVYLENDNKNVIDLDEPPKLDDSFVPNLDSGISTNVPEHSDRSFEPVDDNDLLNLNDPPISDEELIAKKAEEIVNPIVNEAIEQHKELETEVDEGRSDVGRKTDSSGDKKSEKSSSDDGFEHVKVDDLTANIDDLEKLEESKEENPFENDNLINTDNANESTNNDDDMNDEILQDPQPDKSLDLINIAADPTVEEHNQEPIEDAPKEEISEEHNDSGMIEIPKDKIHVEENSNADYIINSAYEMADKEVPQEYEDDHVADFVETLNSSTPICDGVNDKHEEEIVSSQVIHPVETAATPVETEQIRVEPIKNDNIETVSTKLSDDKHVEEIREKFSRILMWKNPIVSGVALGVVLLFQIALMCDFSVISVLAYCGIFILSANLCCKISSRFNLLSQCPFSESEVDINAADIQYLINSFMQALEWILKEIKSITIVESFMKNLKAILILYFMTYIGEWFNLLSLIFIGTILLFTAPLFVEKYDREIKQVTRQIKYNLNKNVNMIKQKLGMKKND